MIRILFIVNLMLVCFCAGAQKKIQSDTSGGEKIKVVYADLQRSIKHENEYKRYLQGNVQIIKDSSFFYCDTAMLSSDYLLAWGNVTMLKGDSIKVFADSMAYEIAKEEADIYGSVYVENGSQVLFSDYIHYDDKVDIAYYTDRAILRNEGAELKSQRGEYRLQESLALFSTKVSVVDEDFNLFADTLLYDTELNKAIFQGPTNIIQEGNKIYCESGFYFLKEKKGSFADQASFQGEDDYAKGDTIKVDGAANTVELIYNAVYQGKDTYAEGDYIRYNDETEEVYIEGNGYVKDKQQEMRSEIINYNKNTKVFSSAGRSKIVMEESTMQANSIESVDGEGRAEGRVILQDTTNDLRIDGEYLIFSQANDTYKIYGKDQQALMRNRIDETDSLFITADTLYTFKKILIDTVYTYTYDSIANVDSVGQWIIDTIQETSIQIDTTQFMNAYHDVTMLSNSFQARCDSMVYNTTDSIITLYQNPIIWSDTTQFTADSIVIHVKNRKIDKIRMFPKSLIINTTDEIFFNQIRGKITTAYFKEGVIDSMTIKGNAQSIYYLIDEAGAYIGINQTDCSFMTFYFVDKKLDHINFDTNPVSKMWPMNKVDHEAIKLEGFRWDIDRRPMEKHLIHPMLVELDNYE